MKNIIIYVAILVSIATYNLWHYLPKGSFYIGNALFIFLLSLDIFMKERDSFVKFVLISLTLSNLLDEIMFDNTKMEINELITVFIIIIIGLIRIRHDRRRTNNT